MIECPHCGALLGLRASVLRTPKEFTRKADGRFGLTPREAQAANLAVEGKTNAQIARAMGLKHEYTVNNRMQKIYQKIGCKNRADMVRIVLLGR